ncbi:MAG: hypothetical protein WCJ29_00480 [bacterium]
MKEPVVFFAWQTPQEAKCVRSRTWWIIAIIIGLAFFIYALVSKNFAFAVMLVMFGVILMIAKQDSEPVDVVIADQGILIGKTLYEYRNITEYTIVPEADLLYFFIKGMLSSHTHVHLPDDIDHDDIRVVFRNRIAENPDRTTEPLVDSIAKRLKIY